MSAAAGQASGITPDTALMAVRSSALLGLSIIGSDPSRNNPLWRDRRISVVTRRDKVHEKRSELWRSLCLLCIVNRMTREDMLLMARATRDQEHRITELRMRSEEIAPDAFVG